MKTMDAVAVVTLIMDTQLLHNAENSTIGVKAVKKSRNTPVFIAKLPIRLIKFWCQVIRKTSL